MESVDYKYCGSIRTTLRTPVFPKKRASKLADSQCLYGLYLQNSTGYCFHNFTKPRPHLNEIIHCAISISVFGTRWSVFTEKVTKCVIFYAVLVSEKKWAHLKAKGLKLRGLCSSIKHEYEKPAKIPREKTFAKNALFVPSCWSIGV